jgi:hypothetical protein
MSSTPATEAALLTQFPAGGPAGGITPAIEKTGAEEPSANSRALERANGAGCWRYLAGLIPTIQPPAAIGAATAVEIARLAQLPSFAQQCGPLGVLTGLPAAFVLPK